MRLETESSWKPYWCGALAEYGDVNCVVAVIVNFLGSNNKNQELVRGLNFYGLSSTSTCERRGVVKSR